MKVLVLLTILSVSAVCALKDEFYELSKGRHWQGDIELTPRQKLIMSRGVKTSNTGVLSFWYRWPKAGGFAWVPYMITPGVYNDTQKQTIQQGLRMIERKTCVRFVPRTTQKNFIRVIDGDGCSSSIGMIHNEQTLKLDKTWCVTPGIVVHEFIHALGYSHMQNHIDRDNFITVNFGNIISGAEHNFQKVDGNHFGNFNTTYDYESVMHYSRRAASINYNKDTIVPKDPKYLDVIGQRKDLSAGDVARLNNMYECAKA